MKKYRERWYLYVDDPGQGLSGLGPALYCDPQGGFSLPYDNMFGNIVIDRWFD